MMTAVETIEYLERLEARLTATLLLAACTAAWGPITRLRDDVATKIREQYAALDAMADALANVDDEIVDSVN